MRGRLLNREVIMNFLPVFLLPVFLLFMNQKLLAGTDIAAHGKKHAKQLKDMEQAFMLFGQGYYL
jgi:hypothetical protein